MSANAPEFDGQPMTKREVLIAREAVRAALNEAWPWIRASTHDLWVGSDTIRDELYPIPTVTRPRVVVHENSHYKVIDGTVYHRLGDWGAGAWHAQGPPATAERVAIWADLLANPTEEVDA